MTTLEDQYKDDERFKNWEKNQHKGRVCAGVIVIAAAVLFFFKEAGYFIPSWIFTWPVLLIAIGIISGIKHQFKNAAWFILIAVGGIFLIGDVFPELSIEKYKIPLILFIIGLVIIFKPKHKHKQYAKFQFRQQSWNVGANEEMNNNSDDFILMNNLFAGTKKNIISKDFKGGDIRNTFGGCELNLMQADIIKEAVITIHQQFGGTKIIVPPHWIIKSDIICVFAGIEDERPIVNATDVSGPKVLILKGQVVMGGVEIVSY